MSPPLLLRPRRGIALGVALVAIVVIAALMAGAFFASNQEYSVGRNTLASQRAFAVAEFGLNKEIASWDQSRYLKGAVNYMPPGRVDDRKRFVADGDTAKIRVSRLNANTFYVVSEGAASMGVARVKAVQRTGAVVRIAYPQVSVRGGLTTKGDVIVTGNGHIYGKPHPEMVEYAQMNAWECTDFPTDSAYGVSVGLTNTVTDKSNKAQIEGYPAPYEKSAISGADSTYIEFGDESANSLIKNADVRFEAGEPLTAAPMPLLKGDGTCDIGRGGPQKYNWGEPLRSGADFKAGCKDYFPIVYIDHSVAFSGGRGQGILIINGDASFNGGFEWYGLIILNGKVDKANGGANIFGAIMARAADVGTPVSNDNTVLGSQNIFYNKCAIESALRGSAVLTAVRERSWAQFYQ